MSGFNARGQGFQQLGQALLQLVAYREQQKRLDAQDSERRGALKFQQDRQTAGDARLSANDEAERKRREIQDKLSALISSSQLNQQGGYVDEPTTQDQGGPSLGGIGNVSRGTRENRDLTTLSRRSVTPDDVLTGNVARGGIDPSRSVEAVEKHRVRESQRAALRSAGVPDEAIDGIIDSGRAGTWLDQPPPSPVQPPRNIDPLSPAGITARLDFENRRPRPAVVPKTGGGKILPAEQVKQLGMFEDLAKSAESLPSMIDMQGGNVGTGPIIGSLPEFARNAISGGGKIDARAMVSSIAGQYMSLISGAAVSPSEAQRLLPFVPNGKDDEPTLKRKALFFAHRLRDIQRERTEAFRRAGYMMDGGGDAPDENQFDDLIPPPRGG